MQVLHIPTVSEFSILKNFNITPLQGTNTVIEKVEDAPVDIKPIEGRLFFKRPNIYLKSDDWVVFGVASTPSVDLVNDAILDVAYTFGDSLKEFVENGKIFYEHGYKHSGKEGYIDEIDVPIGIPVAAEIANNQLFVWILLNKNHPLSQKIYNTLLQTKDQRLKNNVFGLSIGAIPEEKPEQKFINGKKVSVPRKMRLYEVSVTGQPVNPSTWLDLLLKSLNSNAKMQEEDFMNEKEKDELTTLLETLEGEEEKSDEKGDMKQEDTKEEMPEEVAQDETLESEDKVEMQVQEELVPDEEAVAQEEEMREDDQLAYFLDKVDLLENRLARLEELMREVVKEEEKEHESLEGSLEELKSLVLRLEKSLSEIYENQKEVADYNEASVSMLNELKSFVSELKSFTKETLENFAQKVINETEVKVKSLLSSSNTEKKEEKPVLKSVPVLGVNADAHPASVSDFSANKEKINAILSDKTKLKSLYDIYNDYKNFKGNPLELSRKKEEVIEKIKSLLSVKDDEAEYLLKELKTRLK